MERKNWDELNLVLEVDPELLDWSYLLELRSKWYAQYRIVKRAFHQLITLVAFSPVWFVLGIGFVIFTEGWWISNIIFLFPVSVTIFVMGMAYISLRYGGISHQETIGKVLKEEIERRKRDQQERSLLY